MHAGQKLGTALEAGSGRGDVGWRHQRGFRKSRVMISEVEGARILQGTVSLDSLFHARISFLRPSFALSAATQSAGSYDMVRHTTRLSALERHAKC